MNVNFDLGMWGRSTIKSYRDFLLTFKNKANGNFYTHIEQYNRLQQNDWSHAICIRHDVDHSLWLAILMAKIEASLGIKTVYYFLTPGDYNSPDNYYGTIVDGKIVYKQDFIDGMRIIHDLGHEVGLHNNLFQLSMQTKTPIIDLLKQEIDFFDKIGMPMSGTASHGSTFVSKLKTVNYNIFQEMADANSRSGEIIEYGYEKFQLNSISMKELGLTYEAYMLNKNLYSSDTGSAYKITSRDGTLGNFDFDSEVDLQVVSDTIDVNGMNVVLIHPDWWKSYDLKNKL